MRRKTMKEIIQSLFIFPSERFFRSCFNYGNSTQRRILIRSTIDEIYHAISVRPGSCDSLGTAPAMMGTDCFPSLPDLKALPDEYEVEMNWIMYLIWSEVDDESEGMAFFIHHPLRTATVVSFSIISRLCFFRERGEIKTNIDPNCLSIFACADARWRRGRWCKTGGWWMNDWTIFRRKAKNTRFFSIESFLR